MQSVEISSRQARGTPLGSALGLLGQHPRKVPEDKNRESHATASGSGLRPVEQPIIKNKGFAFSQSECTDEVVDNITQELRGLGQPILGVSSTQPQQVPVDKNRESYATASASCFRLVEQPIFKKKIKIAHIPEFDTEKNCAAMPKWIRYDPTKEDLMERYMCIVYDCPLGNDKQRIE